MGVEAKVTASGVEAVCIVAGLVTAMFAFHESKDVSWLGQLGVLVVLIGVDMKYFKIPIATLSVQKMKLTAFSEDLLWFLFFLRIAIVFIFNLVLIKIMI